MDTRAPRPYILEGRMSRRRILLIEDEPSISEPLASALGREGFDAVVAATATEGLDAFRSRSPDLVLLDVMLPGMNGFDVCRAIRSHGRDVAILMLTAKTQVFDRVIGLKLGADDYLTKPFDPSELLARVEALLRRVRGDKNGPVARYQFGDVEIDFERAEVRPAAGR
jgi:two-component system response regulator RegX3